MAGISNLKRVQAIIRERTSNNKLITILSFLFAFIILLSTFIYPKINYSIKVKVLDYSSAIISSLYSPINTINNSIMLNINENTFLVMEKSHILFVSISFFVPSLFVAIIFPWSNL